MAKNHKFLTFGIIVLTFLLMIYINVYFSEMKEHESLSPETSPLPPQPADVIKNQQLYLEQCLKDYDFPRGTLLKHFQLAEGGRPLQNILLTTWRSGSTFLGDILNAVPGNFYHYEPLLHLEIMQVRGPPTSKKSLEHIKKLLKCNYTDMDDYLNYGRDHINLFTHNHRLWEYCNLNRDLCLDSDFLSKFCKLFPFQSVKVVRLRLNLAEEILSDKSLNAKILLLIRDPRGIVQSRKHRDWCPGNPDCEDPSMLCADMISDYSAALKFLKKYPQQFKVLRYEDFCLELEDSVNELFQFFGLSLHPDVQAFLDTHTKLNFGGVSSTYRDSKTAPFHWRFDLSSEEIRSIENNCTEAMDLWGYVKSLGVVSEQFNPLAKYSLLEDNNS